MSETDREFEASSPLTPGSEAPSGHADAAVSPAGEPEILPPVRTPGFAVSRTVVAVLAACALVAALAAWLDGRRVQREFRGEVAQRLAGIESSTTATAKSEVELAGLLKDAQAKLNLLESQVAESQSQQAALEALYRDLAPSRDEIAISEIEQVLLVANQQLQLAGNVPSALTALQLADLKLRQLDRPQFLPLRRALTNDMDALRAVPFVDITGLSLKLDQAIALAPTLPLAMDERLPQAVAAKGNVPSPDLPTWRQVLVDAWAQLRDLVRIESSDRPAAPLLPPTQQYFLRENLRLRLLGARIALQNHDDASFRADVAASDALLKQYFDTRTKPVQSVQAALKLLAATPTASAMPSLTRSLEAVRALRVAQERGPGRASAAPAR
jgi:uroporphyrin-3 C-methyltransferase